MELLEFKDILLEEIKKNNINIKLDDTKIEQLYKYMKKIIDWNDKINLTAITDEKMFIVKHFVDSLTISSLLEDKQRILDVGTGGGFPSIPNKILYPEKEFVLIDAVNKKLNVIRDSISDFNFDKIEIIHTRAEDLAKEFKYREGFDSVTTRAVSNFTTIMEYMLPFVKVGGTAVCMKGPNFQEELDEGRKALEILGGEIKDIITLNIDEDFERNIIVVSKKKTTPKQYPRNGGKPLKEPIR